MTYTRMAGAEWFRLEENKALQIYEDGGKWFVKDLNLNVFDIYETDTLEDAKAYVEKYNAENYADEEEDAPDGYQFQLHILKL